MKRASMMVSWLCAGLLANAQEAPKSLPYAAVHNPEFFTASEATFMTPDAHAHGGTRTANASPDR